MKTYQISVVCSDATTQTLTTQKRTKKEATAVMEGIIYGLKKTGKNIFINKVKLIKN